MLAAGAADWEFREQLAGWLTASPVLAGGELEVLQEQLVRFSNNGELQKQIDFREQRLAAFFFSISFPNSCLCACMKQPPEILDKQMI